MTRYRFGGHEGFAPRSPWPVKGVTALAKDPYVFSRDDATVIFGVGKNMVASIRFWCLQMGLIRAGRERGMFEATELGKSLFDLDNGRDPYLDFPETLWILHHQICTRFTPNSIFGLVFGSYPQPLFTRDSLVHWVVEQTQRRDPESRVSRNTIERDIDILIRTYRFPKMTTRGRADEDSFDSPLAELGLIDEIEPGRFKLQRRSSTVPNTTFVESVLLSYWRKEHPDERVLSFDVLQHQEGSPGKILCLSPNDFAETLEKISRANGTIYFDETAGMRSVHLKASEAINRLSNNTDALLGKIYGGTL